MIIVYDIGTTLCKGALFAYEGQLLKTEAVPLTAIPQNNGLYHEADAEEWISAIKSITKKLTVELSARIDAISISGNGPTLVPVSKEGKPLFPAMTWMDRRGIKEAKDITDVLGAFVDPSFYLPKALWIKRNRQDVYEKTDVFLSCPEFLAFRLTGQPVMVFPAEGFEPLIWNKTLLRDMGLAEDKFPPFITPGESAGKITGEAAKEFSLPEGLPVFVGGPDFVASLLGTGTVYPGRACDRSGTSEGINLCSSVKINDKRLLSLGHVIKGNYNISATISTSGKSLEWFKNLSGCGGLTYDDFLSQVKDSTPGSSGLIFLPYLSGERAPLWDPLARGAFIGLSLNHSLNHMVRSVLEAVGFAIRDVIEVMEANGLKLDELRITGSPAKSPLWNQIKADITGKKILVPKLKDSELAGDLVFALYGLGIFDSLENASESVVEIEKVYTPNEDHKEIYDKLFALYRESYIGLKNVFHSLAKL